VKHPKHPRTKAQAAASRKWAAAGRRSQKIKRAYEKAHNLPTRTAAQHQQSLKAAAAGRASQKRKREGLKPLPKHPRALAGAVGGSYGFLAAANEDWPCCAATAIATHLYVATGIVASYEDVVSLHLAAGGEQGALIPELLEVASSGFAGTRLSGFGHVDDLSLPGTVAGLRLPGGTHAALILSRVACVSWGRVLPVTGELEESWWLEWAT
jgi:hypothetical protein